MADSDIELLSSYVWGETAGLTSEGQQPDATQERLLSVVAYIALKARPRGLLDQMKRAGKSVSTDETANYSRMKDAVAKVAREKYADPVPLPQQAALWQIDSEGRLLSNANDLSRTPPAWIYHDNVRRAGEFSNKAGLRFRLYELVDPPPFGQLGYISSYSSTGLTVRTWRVSERTRKVAWGVGIAASLLFVIGAVSATRSGRTDGKVRTQVSSTDAQYGIVDRLARNCIEDQKLFPKWKRSACDFLDDGTGKYMLPAQAEVAKPAPVEAAKPAPGEAAKPAQAEAAKPAPVEAAKPAANKPVTVYGPKVGGTIALIRKCLNVGVTPADTDSSVNTISGAAPDADAAAAALDAAASCRLIARSAGDLVTVKPPVSYLDDIVATAIGARTIASHRSILLQLLCATLGIAALAIALGLGTKGRVLGIWIDERNRMSLARAQVTLWTIVALGGFATTALFNIGLGAPVSFPQIPPSIAAALGIAFASPMISALILNSGALKSTDPLSHVTTVGGMDRTTKDFSDRGSFLAAPSSGLEARENPTQASLADVFVGERVSDTMNVDISRLQNVILTVTLVLGYFVMLIEHLRSISPESILSGVASLPDPGAAFTAVLLVSHATYLGTKAYNVSPKANETDGH